MIFFLVIHGTNTITWFRLHVDLWDILYLEKPVTRSRTQVKTKNTMAY